MWRIVDAKPITFDTQMKIAPRDISNIVSYVEILRHIEISPTNKT